MRASLHRRGPAPARRPTLLLGLAALMASTPAAAQDYPARQVSGWTVSASKDGKGCFVTRSYDGPGGTTLLLGLDVDGSNHLSVLNDNWSIREQERLNLDFRLSNGGYMKHPVVGMASGGKHGFVTTFDPKFPNYLASSKALHISRGDVPVEQLSLAGSGSAIAELRRCVWIFKSKAASGPREERRSTRIPLDPFAAREGESPQD